MISSSNSADAYLGTPQVLIMDTQHSGTPTSWQIYGEDTLGELGNGYYSEMVV